MSHRNKKTRTNELKKATGAKTDHDTKNNKHITRISATPRTDSAPSEPVSNNAPAPTKEVKNPPAKPTKTAKASKTDEKPLKEVFLLVRPFVALGRYIRDSWRELRQVRWPNRKATWKMTLAVLIYCAVFFAVISREVSKDFFTFS